MMPPLQSEAISRRFPPVNDADRAAVLRYVTETPLQYGDWKYLKALYKQAEKQREAAILGTLIGRLDAERLSADVQQRPVWLDGQPFGEIRAVTASASTLYIATSTLPGFNRTRGAIHA